MQDIDNNTQRVFSGFTNCAYLNQREKSKLFVEQLNCVILICTTKKKTNLDYILFRVNCKMTIKNKVCTIGESQKSVFISLSNFRK